MHNLAQIDSRISMNSCFLTHDAYIFEVHHLFWDIDKFVMRGWLKADVWHGTYNILKRFKIYDPVSGRIIEAIPDDTQLQRNFHHDVENSAEIRVVSHWIAPNSAKIAEEIYITYAINDIDET